MPEEMITIPLAEYERLRMKRNLRDYIDDIRLMRQQQASYQAIADKYGCSRQRIHQLLREQEE
jgi:DNA invertase Pin-like site-specific DNA recombinase